MTGAQDLVIYGTGAFQFSSGVPTSANSRAILIDCTVSGTVTLTFQDGSAITINLQGGQLYSFNYAIALFTLGSATANAFGIK